MLLRKYLGLIFVLLLVVVLSACSPAEQKEETPTVPATSPEQTVTVKRGDITPTISAQTTIVPAEQFIIFSQEKGLFNTSIEVEQKVSAGGVLGTINGKALKSPVGGTVTSIAPSGESVPSNYPVVVVQYTGFALCLESDNFLSTLPANVDLKAKFQVHDGVGPTNAIAVVVPVDNGEEGILPKNSMLQCLIGQDVNVKSGQSATAVITAQTRKDVLVLPLSVIAGRQGVGMVHVVTKKGEHLEKEVKLGVSDGANIEILSGVKEGDIISAIPPNLDPR